MKNLFVLFLACFLISSCTKVEKSQIVGNWRGVTVETPDKTQADASAVRYHFKADDTYSNVNMGGASESGTYRTSGNMIYLKSAEGSEFPLEVRSIEANQMSVNINPIGGKLLLILKKTN